MWSHLWVLISNSILLIEYISRTIYVYNVWLKHHDMPFTLSANITIYYFENFQQSHASMNHFFSTKPQRLWNLTQIVLEWHFGVHITRYHEAIRLDWINDMVSAVQHWKMQTKSHIEHNQLQGTYKVKSKTRKKIKEE